MSRAGAGHRRRAGPVVLCVLLLLAGSACDRERREPVPEAPEIPVRLDLTLHPQIRLDHERPVLEDRVVSGVVAWVRSERGLRLPVTPENPLSVAARVDVSEDLTRLVVTEVVRLRWDRTWPLEVEQRHEVVVGPAGVDLSASLAEGIQGALETLARMAGLFDRDPAALRAQVLDAAGPPELRALAARILQDRRAKEAAEDLVAALDGAPAPLRLTLLDVLGVLSTPELAGRWLAKVDGRRLDEVGRALRAAALVGGREAQEFCAWMAAGHPDERVRQTALEAYQQLTESVPSEELAQLGLPRLP